MSADIQHKFSRIGVLDIGSNSVRFVIYELFGASFTSVYNEKVLAGLGRDLNVTGALHPQGRHDALIAMKRFKMIAEAQNLDRILIAATAAMRIATDAPDFIREVKEAVDWDISPISGAEEARLTAQGLLAAEPRADGIAADLGGASLELIHIQNGEVGSGVSYPIGPFRMLNGDMYFEETVSVETVKASVNAALDEQGVPFDTGLPLYLIGGAWRNLGILHQERHLYPMRTVQSYPLMPGAAADLARWAYGPGRDDVKHQPGLAKRRAETLPYGGVLLETLLERLDPPIVYISTTGLREGLIWDAMPVDLRVRDALLDGCQDLAQGNLQGLHFADPLFEFLTPLAPYLPRVFSADNEDRLRRAACHLVGIGKGLHPDYRPQLVFEDVLYAPLAGLTHKERAYLALILFHSYTSKRNTPNDAAIKLLLSHGERNAALAYGTAIRLGVVISGRSPALLSACHLSPSEGVLHLQATPDHTALLTDRVGLRLEKLATMIGMTSRCVFPI